MSTQPLLVLFVSGWGRLQGDLHPVFARHFKPFLGDLVSAYPLLMLRMPAEMPLSERYRTFGSMRSAETAISLADACAQADVSKIAVADPDRFGLLCEQFDGPGAGKTSQNICVPFPPGLSLQDSYETTIRLVKKQVLAKLDGGSDQLVLACFPGPWTASLYGDPGFLAQAVDGTSQAVQEVVEEALESGYRILLVSDTARLAPMDAMPPAAAEGAEELLPMILIHPALEGLRASRHDTAQHQELPMRGEGLPEQVAATIAELLALPAPAGAAKPLFAELIPLTSSVV